MSSNDAELSSSNGEASCAACHVFGDFDSLSWDLGNPDDVPLNDPNPFRVSGPEDFHPLKGPMTTQSLRGLANHGPMHWRGDRTGGNDCPGNPTPCALDEDAAFNKFIVAFEGLLGRSTSIAPAEMQAFTDFILEVTYPPNPVRALDNSLNTAQQNGRNLYFGRNTDIIANCNGCHTLNPAGGFFGGDGFMSFEGETQLFKIPHLRNLYQKVGMFGMPKVAFFRDGNSTSLGDQVRGVGFLHDGSVDTLFRFHGANVFDLSTTERADMEQFMLAFDSNLAPIVGQQITRTSTNGATVDPRINQLIARAAAGECEVAVKGTLAGLQRGWVRLAAGTFQSDRAAEAPITDAALRGQTATAEQERTYTCAPPGSGQRIGVDRDQDGFFDRDELDAGSDPADPLSVPGGGTTTTTTSTPGSTTTTTTTPTSGQSVLGRLLVVKDPGAPAHRQLIVRGQESQQATVIAGNPRIDGATLSVFLSGATPTTRSYLLPGAPWRAIGNSGFKYLDPTGLHGPVTRVVVKQTAAGLLLRAQMRGRNASLDLVPPNPGDGAVVRLQIHGVGARVLPALRHRPRRRDDRAQRRGHLPCEELERTLPVSRNHLALDPRAVA